MAGTCACKNPRQNRSAIKRANDEPTIDKPN